MTADNRTANALDEMARGTETLRAADELLRMELYNDAISRAYYAAYHWARAVLLTEGLESKTHRGLNQLLGLHFVRVGRLDQEATALLARLEDSRSASDYSASFRFSADEARGAIQSARQFLELCRPLLPAKA